jgi:hypothetical protein
VEGPDDVPPEYWLGWGEMGGVTQCDCGGRDARRAGERECRGGADPLGESARDGSA